ncbi:vWA domain-containing protein [Shinella sp.]|uniref:vWA domain-containing protein n=1 Tax=Shinella sp. TaxID=1870904 RepID=UPI003F70F084
MTKNTEKWSWLSRLLRDRRGNFGMMTALIFPVMLAAGGVAVDLTKMVMVKAELQDATDAAALAAASALANDGKTAAQAKEIGMRFLKSQMTTGGSVDAEGDQKDKDKDKNDFSSTTVIDIKETALANNSKSFQVDVATAYTLEFNPFTRLLGQKSIKMNAKSTAESGTAQKKSAISMYLVLDRSGSMSFKTDDVASQLLPCQNWTESNWGKVVLPTVPCYTRKIAALKKAVASLVTVFNTLDPEQKYVRTGAISYNDDTQSESKLAWGTKGASDYVNALPEQPTGGTDSHEAFATAVAKIAPANKNKETEIGAHKDKNGQVPIKYIIFMTDGENTSYDGYASTSQAKKSDDETRASCVEARDAGVIVYTVAFMAPTRGQTLLRECATTPANYFQAENMTALIAAFKAIGESAAAMASRLTK